MNLSIRLPQFAPHEKLAFIERVCGLLIESRFSHGRAEAWLGSFSKRDSDDAICDKPRFALPAAPAKERRLPARQFSIKGILGFLASSLVRVCPSIAAFTQPARGSPVLIAQDAC